ncbi:protein of unknown function [Hymenobacter mucosus]|uniref:DUF748 domain-containing protein n=1 Tax=Hymenobacter mucosus TaxID=1411120 RepID=A0A238XVU7_9BACT|nr:protein of unknown function [Hymenobacter mucosus]
MVRRTLPYDTSEDRGSGPNALPTSPRRPRLHRLILVAVLPTVALPIHQPPPPKRPTQHRWLWWLLGIGLVLGGLLLAASQLLDPWLRRQAEQQVARQSQGRYLLRIGSLDTKLWQGTVHLRNIRLRTAAGTSPDTASLPRLQLRLGRLDVVGVGLVALLRRNLVPIDSIGLDSLNLHLAALPKTASSQPLHVRLPVAGIRLRSLAVRHTQVRYGQLLHPTVQVGQSTVVLRDVLLNAAGASDSGRLGYAAAVAGQVRGLVVQVPGHTLRLVRGQVSSETGKLTLDSAVVHPGTPISAQRTAAIRVQTVVPHLALTGLDVAGLARRRFRADSLRLTLTHLALTLPATPPPPLHELLAAYFTEFRLGHMLFRNETMRLDGLDQAPTLRNVRLQATDVQVLPRNHSTLYYARAWAVQTGRMRATLDAPYYTLAWQALRADTRTQQLHLTNLGLTPTMDVVKMSRRKKHAVSRIVVRLSELAVAGLNYHKALRDHQLIARQLTLRNGLVHTTGDGRFAQNPKQSVATPEALAALPFQISIDRVRIRRGTVNMVYRSPRDPQPGTLSINQLAVTLRNFSNDPRRMSAAHPLTGEASGRLQNQCAARLSLRANLLDPTGRHTLSGVFTTASLGILNPMTIPTRGVAFRSGTVQRIRFQMRLDQQQAVGTMWGEYTDLKLQLLNKNNKAGLLKRVETSLINGIAVRDNNPRKPGKPLKEGQILSRRELRYSVFTLWRQGLVSGALNSVGIPKKIARNLSEGE